MKNSNKMILFALALFTIAGAAAAHFTGASPVVMPLAFAAVGVGLPVAARKLNLSTPFAMLMVTTTLTTTAVRASYGGYYADNSKNTKDLYTKQFQAAEFDTLFKMVKTDLTVYRKALVTSTATTQQFQLAWTPNGSYTFTPSPIPLQGIKVDQELSSYDVMDEWVGFLHEQGKSQAEQPLAKYILENLLLPQHIEDIELNGCYFGVQGVVTPGAAGSVGAMMDGVKKVINDAYGAGTISPISVGAIPTDPEDYVDYVMAFGQGIDSKDRKRPMTLAVSLDREYLFKQGMESKYNTQYKSAEDIARVKLQDNITVKGFAAMGTSDKMFCTPDGNAVKPVNMGKGPLWQFEVVDRRLKVWTDHWMGYGFIDHGRVYTNPEELS